MIKYEKIDGRHYALTPETKKRGDKRILTVRCSGLTHIVMITDPSMSEPGTLFNEDMKARLEDLVNGCSGKLKEIRGAELGVDGKQVTFIDFVAYQIGGQSYEVEDRAQRIYVFGAAYNNRELTIYLPEAGSKDQYYCDISLEMTYVRFPCTERIIQRKGPFSTVEIVRDTGYDYVEFERILGYTSGMVSYEVDVKGKTYSIPVTVDMTGKKILIKKPFRIKGNKIKINQVKENR